jgi:IS605 OrfB family transposase
MIRAVPSEFSTRVLRLRLKDKHIPALQAMAAEVNFVWNYCNELAVRVFERERRFLTGFDFNPYMRGASKEGLGIGSAVFQEVAEQYVVKRRAAQKVKLRWRCSSGPRRSLGWIPFKSRSLSYKAGQVVFQGMNLSLWDSYGLADYELGAGSISEDARGRWYLNICVKVKKKAPARVVLASAALGVDLGLKHLVADSDGNTVEAQRFYRGLEPKIAAAQRAGKKDRVRALHAKAANRRKDFLHKLSTNQSRSRCAIFVGNVNAAALAQTTMAKSVHDAGWSAYRNMLRYKCDDAGAWFKEVEESYSTQTCYVCKTRSGPKGLVGLSVRAWTCLGCGTVHDRDRNASMNILHTGLDWLEKEFAAAEAKAEMPGAVVNKAFEAAGRFAPRPGMAV